MTATTDARLFGLDLRQLAREWRAAWADALRSPALAWLTPEAVVQLRQADGVTSLWQGGQRLSARAVAKAEFTALELPQDLLLARTLTLPAMDAVSTAAALALQAQALSPFPSADLVWGHRARPGARNQQQVDLVLASRQHLARHLQAQPHAEGAPPPEVWALPPGGAPIVLPGHGEGARRAAARRGRALRLALLALALALLAAIAITPTLQLRARAIQAVTAYDQLARETAPAMQQREQLLQTTAKLATLNDILAARIEPLRVLDRLTQVLPDDTALQSFSLKGSKLTVSGLTGNSSALMQTLSQQPGMRDVRAPSPATRSGGPNSRENFVVELTLDPQAFGVAAAPAAPATPAAAPGGKP